MRRSAIGLALLAATVALPTVAQDKDKLGGDDKLVGTWSLVTVAEPDGTRAIPEGVGTFTFMKGGKLTITSKGFPDTMGTWKADPSRMPHELDLMFDLPGQKKTTTLRTIYRIDGDKLENALSPKGPDQDRPKAIDPKECEVRIFKRVK
jgi:uncharacterized protein (TIGR03067 family)